MVACSGSGQSLLPLVIIPGHPLQSTAKADFDQNHSNYPWIYVNAKNLDELTKVPQIVKNI